ncbi:MAG: ATP phosphoribosyltransferase [Planctomycetota bacterium]
MVLKLALPSGSLQESTFQLMRMAGFDLRGSGRSYYPAIDDPEIEVVLFRAQEVSRYVADGVMDAGLTGIDWIMENGSDVVEVAELTYSKRTSRPARWVVAVPEASPVRDIKDLDGKVVATEAVNLTTKFLAEQGVSAKVEFSWGSTEAKAGLVDAIVELTETGGSLKSNRLRIVAEILSSTPRFIANKAAWDDKWKRQKIENIVLLLQGAMVARTKVGLKLNAPRESLGRIVKLLPALHTPTVSPLADENWFAVETVLDEPAARELIPELKRAGAQGIIEYSLNKVIP